MPPTRCGEKFTASDLVRSTWTAANQHAAPASALFVRALERCAPREDTRLTRVMIDLLGAVPADGELWVRARWTGPASRSNWSAPRCSPLAKTARLDPWRGQAAGGCISLDTQCRGAPAHSSPRARCRKPSAEICEKVGTATTSTAWTGDG